MKRIIQKHELIPLKKEISKINDVDHISPLLIEYIDFLADQNMRFSFQHYRFSSTMKFSPSRKEEFIQHIKNSKAGNIEFEEAGYKDILPEYFLYTFVGKEISKLEEIFNNVQISDDVCDFYRSLGLIALKKNEKLFYRGLTSPAPTKYGREFQHILFKANIPYFMQKHEELFNHYDLNVLWNNWQKKISLYEDYNKRGNFLTLTSKVQDSKEISNQIYKNAKIFTFKLTGMLIFKKTKDIDSLIEEYKEVLSHKEVFDFFKDNKCQELTYAYKKYRDFINSCQANEIIFEETNLFQKNIKVDIVPIMQKHLLNYEKTVFFLKEALSSVKSQEGLGCSFISFEEKDKKCIFHLSSSEQDLLYIAYKFLKQTINNKDIFINYEKHKSMFSYLKLNDDLDGKSQKREKAVKI